eukprot:2472104-Pyramimonas_sp.AAC.1
MPSIITISILIHINIIIILSLIIITTQHHQHHLHHHSLIYHFVTTLPSLNMGDVSSGSLVRG